MFKTKKTYIKEKKVIVNIHNYGNKTDFIIKILLFLRNCLNMFTANQVTKILINKINTLFVLSVCLYCHVLRREDGHVLRKALDF